MHDSKKPEQPKGEDMAAKVARLEAELAAAKEDPKEAAVRKQREANAKARAALKASTKKEGAHALYFIPESAPPFYRQGILFKPGQVVRLPLEEDPSVEWEAVEDAKPVTAVVPKAPPAGRPSDKDV